MRRLRWMGVVAVALLASRATAGTGYGEWQLLSEDVIETDTACLRYSAARVDKVDDDLLASDSAPYDIAVRITTCDLRFVAQLRQGKLPREWEADKAKLSIITRDEVGLLSELAKRAGEAALQDADETWEFLNILAAKAAQGQLFMSLQTPGDSAAVAPPPMRGRSRLFSGIAGDKREKRLRYDLPGWRITQTLELHSKQTDLHLFGVQVLNTHDHHSGSVTWVRGDRLDEKDHATWTFISCNHGTCPGQGTMQTYAICESQVRTEGWFAADGECDGWWGYAHVCNDDTALQINNAFGIWSDDRCYGRKRPNRPWCQVHWR